eukprot:TRINITY_DN101444_c0_g1_i1.p1 TRINITY_DN101444_c0_g1~~TRINITY_DN101444_c0_g1_i1.p1  ORF type:complete len:469 (+),score=122.26 TRINITY_DN101444_c0_g1_i1:177-1583(+)
MSAIALTIGAMIFRIATAAAPAASSPAVTALCGDLIELVVEIFVVIGVFYASTFIFKQVRGSKLPKTAAPRAVSKPFAVAAAKATPQASGQLAELQQELSAIPQAQTVFARLSSMGVTGAVPLEAFLEACTARSAWALASEALKMGLFDTEINTAAYNVVMKGFATCGQLTYCVDLCKDMRAKGLEPSAATYGLLLDACLNASDYLRAQTLLLDIGKAGQPLDARQCLSCTRGLVSSGHRAEAEELLAAVEGGLDAAAVGRMKDVLGVSSEKISLRPRTKLLSAAPPTSLSPQGAWRGASFNSSSPVSSPEGSSWRERASSEPQAPTTPAAVSRLTQYIELNNLDPGCAQMLRGLTPVQADWVMDHEFIIGVDASKGSASAKAVAAAMRSKQKSADFWRSYPARDDLNRRLSQFVQVNKLDRRCAATLEQLSEENLIQIMDQEFVVTVNPQRGSASSKVIWQLMRLRN